MELLIFWVVMALIVAIVGASKGRSGFGWFLYGFLIWPIALVHALCMAPTPAVTAGAVRVRAEAEGRRPCPYCAEAVKAEAKLCPHCRSELAAGWASKRRRPEKPARDADPPAQEAVPESERGWAALARRVQSD